MASRGAGGFANPPARNNLNNNTYQQSSTPLPDHGDTESAVSLIAGSQVTCDSTR